MTTTEPSAPLRTGWEDDTPSSDSLALAALRAMADRTADWAEAVGGRVRRASGVVLADALSPCLFLNVATVPAVVDPATARAVADFFPAGRPFLLATPHPTADLRPAGLALVGHPPFMVRPAGGTPPEPPPGVTVVEVRDAAGLDVWDRVLAAGFPAPHSPAPPALLGGPARFWLARVDGEPVGTALSYVAHGVVDVEAVATLPGYRGRGVGAALTWAATLADPDLPAVLIASDDGAGVYREMGYLPVTRWTLWCRP
ncbi:MAG: GNAT family N-acetyltransferase [Pseudonocardia sp.]|nr:GNAT family N-acetyltransferase [Pseudonocardia sp.]